MAQANVCARCRRGLSEREVRSPATLYTEHGLVCEQCAPSYRAALQEFDRTSPAPTKAGEQAAAATSPPAAEPSAREAKAPSAAPEAPTEETKSEAPPEEAEAPTPPPAESRDALDLLDEMRREVSLIRRLVQYEKASVWNVLGAATQCFAIGALVMACVQWSHDAGTMLLLALVLQVMTLTFFVHGK